MVINSAALHIRPALTTVRVVIYVYPKIGVSCGLHNIDPIAESTQGYGNDCGNDPTIFVGFVLVLYLLYLNCFGVNVFLFAHSLLLGRGILTLFHGLPNFVGLRVQEKTIQ